MFIGISTTILKGLYVGSICKHFYLLIHKAGTLLRHSSRICGIYRQSPEAAVDVSHHTDHTESQKYTLVFDHPSCSDLPRPLPCPALCFVTTMTDPAVPSIECPLERAIVHTLLYFELFSYPLTEKEIWQFTHDDAPETRQPGASASFEAFQEKLYELENKGIVFRFQDFFQTRPHPDWTERRLEYNRRADAMLPVAHRMSRLIAAFPYIRAVFVSGSLSKHSMRPDSDIDFFLITAPGRLWLARTLLVIFKKIFLFNSHKYFCVNYFIDTEHLEIEEKNLFTATEVITLLPMHGREWYHAFCRKNQWAWRRFPHSPKRPDEAVPRNSRSWFKRSLEWALGGRLGDWLDRQAMYITVKFWKRKFRHFDDNTFNAALKSRRYVSKHHPLHFQQKVLAHLEMRMEEMQAMIFN